MTNFKVFNEEARPLYTRSLNTAQSASYYSQLGQVYTVNTGAQVMSAGNFHCLQLTNPSTSTKTVYINSIFGGSTATINMSMLRDGSFSQSGTSITPRNNNWEFPDNSSCSSKRVATASDPTSGGVLLESLYQNDGNFYLYYQGQLIIPPGATDRFLCIRIENPSLLASLVVVIGISWWEN